MNGDKMLKEMEVLRNRKGVEKEPVDYIIRVCEAIVASETGYKNRMDWTHLQVNS